MAKRYKVSITTTVVANDFMNAVCEECGDRPTKWDLRHGVPRDSAPHELAAQEGRDCEVQDGGTVIVHCRLCDECKQHHRQPEWLRQYLEQDC